MPVHERGDGEPVVPGRDEAEAARQVVPVKGLRPALALGHRETGRTRLEVSLDEAEPLYDRTLGLRRRVFGDEHPNTLRAAANQAGLYMKRGRYDEAETLYALAVAGARQSLPEGHANTARYLRGHGRALLKVTRYDEAETTLIEARELSEKAHGPADDRTVEAIESLIELYETRGDGEAAATWRSKISPP